VDSSAENKVLVKTTGRRLNWSMRGKYALEWTDHFFLSVEADRLAVRPKKEVSQWRKYTYNWNLESLKGGD